MWLRRLETAIAPFPDGCAADSHLLADGVEGTPVMQQAHDNFAFGQRVHVRMLSAASDSILDVLEGSRRTVPRVGFEPTLYPV